MAQILSDYHYTRVDANNYNMNLIKLTMNNARIISFNSDFISMSPKDLNGVIIPATGFRAKKLLPLAAWCKLQISLSFYHHICHKKGGAVNISLLARALFDELCRQPLLQKDCALSHMQPVHCTSWVLHLSELYFNSLGAHWSIWRRALKKQSPRLD